MGVGLGTEDAKFVAENGEFRCGMRLDLKRVSREMHIYGECNEFVNDLKVQ